MNRLFELFHIKRIWLKFALTVILAVLFTMSFTSYLRLANDYSRIPDRLNEKLQTTTEVTALAVSDPLWNYNLEGIATIGDSIFSDKEIYAVQIKDLRKGLIYTRSIQNEDSDLLNGPYNTYSQKHKIFQGDVYIGDIEITMLDVYLTQSAKDVFNERINDMLIQLVILIVFISLISLTITNPLKKLEIGAIELAEGNYTNKIDVSSHDEVGMLAEKFNYMAQHIESANEELVQMNNMLEDLVKERTNQLIKTNEYLEQTLAESEETQAELQIKNDELEDTLGALQETREELIHTAKSSLTSQLVAGVAHEINTPVGVSLTTSSFLHNEVEKLLKASSEGKLTKKDFIDHLQAIDEASKTIQRNLENSASLIESFKQVAVDQTGQRKRTFNLKQYYEEVIKNLNSAFKHTQHEVVVQCPDNINLDSYPGAYSQILTNLLMNSLDHGFENTDSGEIKIQVEKPNNWIIIVYSDNGKGISPKDLPHIFVPYYSTAHSRGGSGLGLSVINNLVTTVLGGTIKCESTLGEGTTFTIRVPEKPIE